MTLTAAQLAALDGNDQLHPDWPSLTDRTADTGEGTLVIIGWNPATNELTYEYTLKGPVDHIDDPNTPNFDESWHVFDHISLAVTDSSGATGSGELLIEIIDGPAPVATMRGGITSDDAHGALPTITALSGDEAASAAGMSPPQGGSDALVDGAEEHHDSSIDHISNFTLGEDKLELSDLFSDGQSLDGILQGLGNGDIKIAVAGDSTVNLTVHADGNETTISIGLSDALPTDTVNAINQGAGSEALQAQLLLQLVTGMN
ncbi:MAG: type I secretion C-terminal target domain-containing protein [Desulfovibrio sp.]|jgi:hypothetical protein|nr:type I secretion C-terminal target domain-containing protein [Desulfovibrio sp.]